MEITVRRDYKSTGKLDRYVFGVPGESCSGAIYIGKDDELPAVVILKIPGRENNKDA
jgi:hypothetical protein